ncbi:MAG TPA: hypothetical protein VHE35_02425 [Kofleriaceae bacterium]|nr:hypothetical protein [Kofleriaceae bacterium]
MAKRAFIVVLVLLRLGMAGLFASQLTWKVPPHFGCPAGDFVFTSAGADGTLHRSTGLCDWIGIESVFSHRDRKFFGRDTDGDGLADSGLPLGPLVKMNGWFVDHVVEPNFGVFGWLIFLTETLIVLSLGLGLLSRFGAAVAVALSVQLTLGVAGVADRATGLDEGELLYWTMIAVSALLAIRPAGRWFGLDKRLRSKFLGADGWRGRLVRLGT